MADHTDMVYCLVSDLNNKVESRTVILEYVQYHWYTEHEDVFTIRHVPDWAAVVANQLEGHPVGRPRAVVACRPEVLLQATDARAAAACRQGVLLRATGARAAAAN